MGKFHQHDVRSVVLDGPTDTKLWSAASISRKIIDSMRCGGGGGGGHRQAEKQRQQQRSEFDGRSDKIMMVKKKKKENGAGSEKLLDLLRMSESEDEDVKKKVKRLEEFKGVVKRLQSEEEILVGAREVRRLSKEDSEARTTLALLGAIPPLVALLDSDDLISQIAALYALLNLGIGNDSNKAAIVKAGAVHKMLKLVESPSPDVCATIVANFLGLSALDSNKPIIGSSGAIPFLVKTLKHFTETDDDDDDDNNDNSNSQLIHDTLRALFNLSLLPSNVSPMVDANLVPILLSILGDMGVSDRILSILSNIVSVPEGRKALNMVPDSFPILVDVLNWSDSPGCQEKATYILMVMAHKAYGDRQAMMEAGIVSSLLELTLLGSTLAQKRASRILEILRVDKGKQVSESYGGGGLGATVSAPLCGSSSSDPSIQLRNEFFEDDDTMSAENRAVKNLVQQSLQNNMRRIVRRANLPQDLVPSDHFMSFTSSSTSKSLPF